MGCGQALLCILLPPLAVLDAGCGTVVIVTLLTLFGWVPGAIAALVIVNQNENAKRHAWQLHAQQQQLQAQQVHAQQALAQQLYAAQQQAQQHHQGNPRQ